MNSYQEKRRRKIKNERNRASMMKRRTRIISYIYDIIDYFKMKYPFLIHGYIMKNNVRMYVTNDEEVYEKIRKYKREIIFTNTSFRKELLAKMEEYKRKTISKHLFIRNFLLEEILDDNLCYILDVTFNS